jgi:hypothetical protein
VTAGSPIGGVPIPDDVSVLSIETEQDAVPKLDGRENPDRSNWVTVKHDLRDVVPWRPEHDLDSAHSLSNYGQAGRAIDSSDDLAIGQWRDLNSVFFGEGRAQRYRILPAAGD